uniref:WASH_WAHD domain-containing protein n=1 Tax=Elaeophora elaphi TaxID=1147741 RepID=A0A0R3S2X7_9BILA
MYIRMIPSDASHEEAVDWIVFGLEQLINLSNEIFERLSNRIKNFSEHADRIQLDLGRVAKKIEQIRKMNTAIVISIPGKFIKIENECQQSVLGRGLRANVNTLRKINMKHRYDLNELKDVAAILNEKQKFYRFTEGGMTPKRRTRQIPDNLQSAADLLLFNTSLNVYADDRFMDPFNNVKIELHMESESKIQQPAPTADDSTLAISVKQKTDPLLYQPESGSLQNFSLPESLFNSTSLPVDSMVGRKSLGKNISNSTESVIGKDVNAEGMSIKPNLIMAEDTSKPSSAISENPVVNSQFFISETNEAHEAPPETAKTANWATPKNETSQARNFATSNGEKLQSSTPPPVSPAPAPPPAAPPPPPPPPLPIQSTIQTTIDSQSKLTIAMSDNRANLMDAIRRAGGAKGAKLRSIRKREEVLAEDISVLPKRNIVAPPSSDDLMSSLARALEQRRKGIFGKKPERREPVKSLGLSEGAFAHMSARIPPPPSKEDNDEYDNVSKIDDYEWE